MYRILHRAASSKARARGRRPASSAGRRRRAALLAAGTIVALAAAACGSPDASHAPGSGARREAVLMELRSNSEDVAPNASMAAISADVRRAGTVVPLDPSKLGVIRDSAAYRLFLHRCNGCHTAPDPSMHNVSDWEKVISYMKYNMQHAGLMPPTSAEWKSILGFLQAHAKK